MEDPELRIQDVETIEAEDIYSAKSKYGKTIGIVDGDASIYSEMFLVDIPPISQNYQMQTT